MKKTCLVAIFGLIALANANAQVKGHGGAAVPREDHVSSEQTQGDTHSNAPAQTPAASSDRDKGKDRAADVGKGKDKGHRKHKNRQESEVPR